MAYMKELIHKCQFGFCHRKAVVEVFDYRNSSYGDYCRPCGKIQVNSLKARERKDPNYLDIEKASH